MNKKGLSISFLVGIMLICVVLLFVSVMLVPTIQEAIDFRKCDKLEGCQVYKCKSDASQTVLRGNAWINRYQACLLEIQIYNKEVE